MLFFCVQVFNLPQVFRSLKGLGFDASKPSIWLIEDVVEYMVGLSLNASVGTCSQTGFCCTCAYSATHIQAGALLA